MRDDYEFGEINWDDTSKQRRAATVKQITGFVIAGIFFFVIFAFFVPYKELFMTEEELRQTYKQHATWLNRCDASCQSNVNVTKLSLMDNCDGLSKLFDERRRNYPLEWKLAIDDRATSLGCPGFPTSTESMELAVKNMREMMAREDAENLQRKEQEFLDQQAQQLPRFRASLQQGNILYFTKTTYQDPEDPNTMVIVVSSALLRKKPAQQRQIAEVFWQKWVNIRAQNDPDSVRIELVHPEGGVIGGSPPGRATPITVDLE